MYSPKRTGRAPDGLGFAFTPLIVAAISAAGSAAAAKITQPKFTDPSVIARAEAERSRKNVVYIAAGGILLLFILSAMR